MQDRIVRWKVGRGRFILGRFTGKTGTHTGILIEYEDEFMPRMYCSCISYAVRGRCRHLDTLIRVARGDKLMAMEIDEFIAKEYKVYESSLRALNELFDGVPYSNDSIFSLYGNPQVGKSLLMLQEAAWFESKGHKVLYIDTEGSLRGFARKWLPVFRSRFGGKKKGKIYAIEKKDLHSLMAYLGLSFKLVSKGKDSPKIEVSIIGAGKESDIEKFVKQKKIDIVIVDSITSPIRIAFSSSTQNFPARADATSALMGALLELQGRYGVAILTTHHASSNPTNPYDINVKMRGGMTVRYYSKHTVYIDQRASKEWASYRRLWLIRAPDKQEWSDVKVVKISDIGYEDVDIDVNELLTDAEKKRIANANKG